MVCFARDSLRNARLPVGSVKYGGCHVSAAHNCTARMQKRAAATHCVQDQGHGAQNLVPGTRDSNQAFGVAGSQLRQGLDADGGARVLHEVADGLSLLTDDSAAQLAGDSKLNLRARNTERLSCVQRLIQLHDEQRVSPVHSQIPVQVAKKQQGAHGAQQSISRVHSRHPPWACRRGRCQWGTSPASGRRR